MQIENNKEIEINEDQLQALYMYISMHFDEMKDEEKKAWFEVMEKIDKDFYEED